MLITKQELEPPPSSHQPTHPNQGSMAETGHEKITNRGGPYRYTWCWAPSIPFGWWKGTSARETMTGRATNEANPIGSHTSRWLSSSQGRGERQCSARNYKASTQTLTKSGNGNAGQIQAAGLFGYRWDTKVTQQRRKSKQEKNKTKGDNAYSNRPWSCMCKGNMR